MNSDVIDGQESQTSRQLAAVLFADIAGYTAMMQRNEKNAIQKAHQFRINVQELVPRYQGQIIQFYGDGCLLIFNSVVNAISCAVSLQESLQSDPHVPVRIGAHQGDIMMEGGNVFGNSVNIAARIESMSVPGAVLLSEKVRTELTNQPEFKTVSLGKYLFKNLHLPMEIFAISKAGFPIPKQDEIDGKFERQNLEKSIAVLPFQNRSSDPEQDYFGEGIAEEIIYGLSQLENLKVVSRAASFACGNLPLEEIAQQLKTEHILEGSIRKMGNKVRVSTQLVNARDGFQIWTERFDRELADIFEIQDEIAEVVVKKMKLTLLGKEKLKPIIKRKTENVDAYQLYLRGRSYLDQRKNIDGALQCFNEALMLDPNFATVHTSVAYAYFYKVVFANYSPNKGFPAAEIAIEKALSLDSTIAEAHTLSGLVRFYYYFEWQQARQAYEKAILLQPKLADTYRVKAYFHSMLLEHSEAVFCAQKACELDSEGFNNFFSLADIYYRARRFEDSIKTYQILLERYPAHPMALDMLASAYFHDGLMDEARRIFQGRTDMPDHPGTYTTGPYIFAIFDNNRPLAKKYLDYLMQDTHEWVPPSIIALVQFALGDSESARKSFQKAIDDKDPGIIYMNVDPYWDPYRQEPIIQEALRNLNLL